MPAFSPPPAETLPLSQIQDTANAPNLYKQGLKHLKAEQFEAARAAFTQALSLDPDNALYACYQAWCEFLCTPARPELSTRKLRQTVKTPAAAEMSWFFLGKIAQHCKLDADATQHFNAVLKLNPKNLDAQRELRLIKIRAESGPAPTSTSLGGRIAGFFRKLGGGS